MNERAELFEHFKSFIEKELRVKCIEKSTTIQFDLGVEGDDAYDLLEEIDKTYEVDWEGFRFEDHFHSEAWFVLNLFSFLLLFTKAGRKKLSQSEKRPLTVVELFSRVKCLKY